MIPLRDNNPTRRAPVFTLALIGLNVLVFLYELSLAAGPGEDAFQAFIFRFGAIPADVFGRSPAPAAAAIPAALTLFTSMFLHGGLLHLAGNMLYLWIFGNNIEDRLGHLRFLAFYLAGGLVAALTHAILTPASPVPMVGASGAISAVLGAYLLLFPRARVMTLIFFGFFIRVVPIPAVLMLGFWFVLQVLQGLPSLGAPEGAAGVAWFAHIGGFLFGMIVIRLILPRPRYAPVRRGHESDPWQ